MAEHTISRRSFMIGSAAVAMTGAVAALTGCTASGSGAAAGTSSSASSAAEGGTITMVWLPDNSSADLTSSREAIGAAIKAACGRDAELMTTTDYNVAIEAIASGQAQMALLGPEGYVQANKQNPAVQAAFTNSDEEGGLDGACYYSRICVKYKSGDTYIIDNIKGGSFSFVSATSTSGFKVPSSTIVSHFGLESSDELLEGGSFFSEVLFGNSHQGSAVNLLAGDADAAAFDDVDVDMYFDLVEGEPNTVGAVYQVKADEQFTIIGISAVLNSPFCFNEDALDEDTRVAITDYFCSDAVANDPAIFVDPEDENAKGIFTKDSDKMCFVEVTDDWYEPIRQLGGAA